MKIQHFLFPILLLAISAVSFAADKEVEELLAKMRETYKTTKSAKFTTTTRIFGDEGEQKADVEVQFKNPNKVKLTLDGMFGIPGKISIISDGKKIQSEVMGEKDTGPFTVEALSEGSPLNLETLCFWDYERQLSTGESGNMKTSTFKLLKDESWDGKKWTVLEETAKEQGVFVRYWIDPKTNYIWRTEVKSLEGDTPVMECKISKLEIGVEIDDKVFEIN